MKKIAVLVFPVLLSVFSTGVWGQTVSDEAKRHFDRGTAAVEMAKTPEGFESATMEFKQAVQLAPNWPDAYYNLGMVQEKAGNYADAIASLKSYLQLAPNANDAESVRSLINKMEYKKDSQEGIKNVFAKLLMRTDLVQWIQISKEGDNAPDWELEHNNDLKEAFPDKVNGPLFSEQGGSMVKSYYGVAPMDTYIFPEFGAALPAVTVNDASFAYRYPIYMIWVSEHMSNGTPVYKLKHGGEMSIKAEIVSTTPPRIKKEQQVNWPDGHITVTTFVYELR